MTFELAFAKLNEEQQAAASHIDGPMMVLAGPGTGKTQIIALRIAKILQETQLEPHNILCLTFTESGVAAMRRRLLEFIGTAAYYVRVCTFHSFCNDIIKENPEKFQFTRELEHLTEIEQIKLFRELLEQLPEGSPLRPFGDAYTYQRDIKGLIQNFKREDLSPEQFQKLLENVEFVLKAHGQAIETFIAINGGSLKAEQLMQMQAQLQGTFFATAFEGFDLEEKTERTAAKKRLKEIYEETVTQLPKQIALAGFYRRYQEELTARGRYDYDDMILFTVQKLKTDANLLARLQETYQYILVDEFQDTNGAQNEVVTLLGSFFDNPNIFVVGDDKQSIYRFQGASVENMGDFYHSYKNSLALVTLQKNYRSQQIILDAATGVIQHNAAGLEKLIPSVHQTLKATAPWPQEKLRLATLENLDSENYFVARQIQDLIRAGTDPSEIAVLYRNNRDSEALVDLFLRLKIPFKLHSGKNLLEDSEIKKLLGLLKWLADPLHDRELFFVLHYDFLKLDTVEVLKLTRAADREHKGIWDILENASQPLKNFRQKTADWLSYFSNLTFAEAFERVVNESGFLQHLLQKENRLESVNRLNSLFDEVKQWNKQNPHLRLNDFINDLSILEENDIALSEEELSTQKHAVALMTAHRSKGLEFEHVFLIRCVDKHWGNQRSQNKLKLPPGLLKTIDTLHKEKNEDERRLFYVALTRAKKTVTLTQAKLSATGKEELPSIFLAELDPAFTQTLDTTELEDEVLQRLELHFVPIQKNTSAEEKQWVKGLLENYQLSVSHLNNYLECPRRFYYENLLRVPHTKNKHQAFGTAIHLALQELLTALQKNPTPDKKLLLTHFERQLNREILTDKEKAGVLEFGLKTLSDYFDRYHTEFQANVYVEYNFAPHNVHVDGVPITGKLDKIEVLDETKKTVHVVDYKTGNPDSKSANLGPEGDYRRQIIFYQLLCDHSTQFPYKMLSGEIDFVQKSGKTGDFIRRRFEVTPEEKQKLLITIKETYEEIQSLAFLDFDESRTCGDCDYCRLTAGSSK